eukprot:505949_1
MEPECIDTSTREFSIGFDINACGWCDDGKGHNEEDTARICAKCTSLKFSADTLPNEDHYNCITHSLVYRPSVVTNRDVCTCYRPSSKSESIKYTVSIDELPLVTNRDACTCYRPSSRSESIKYTVSIDELPLVTNRDACTCYRPSSRSESIKYTV